MLKLWGALLVVPLLLVAVGCGGSSSAAAPTPTPTPSQIFANTQSLAQTPPISLGTSGANQNDVGPKSCCLGTLGSLWTKTGVTNPVILSNNHVLARSSKGVAGEAINQPLQQACTSLSTPPLTVANLTQGAVLKPVANEPHTAPNPCAQATTGAPLCGHAPSNVDAAIAEIVPGQVATNGNILDLGPAGTTTISTLPPSSQVVVNPAIGEAVGKSGRTTGLTCSTIQSLNLTILIDYEGTCGDSTATPPVARLSQHTLPIR